jgi:translation initiation factor 1A
LKNNPSTAEIERELIFKVESQEYAQVTKLLGNCRLEVQCFDGKTRLANIRGSMRKKVWIKINDVVLILILSDNKMEK